MKRRNIFFLILLTVFYPIPLFVFSQGSQQPFFYFDDLFFQMSDFITNFGLPFIFAAVLIFFLWGLALFILKADDEEQRNKGKKIMLWGIILLFVMASFWAIIEVLQIIFGTGTEGVGNPPSFPQAPSL